MIGFNSYINGLDLSRLTEYCINHGRLTQYAKGDYFIKAGEESQYIGFVECGYFNYMVHNSSEQKDYLTETIGVTSFHVDSIISSARKGIVSINYDRWDRNEIREQVKQCIEKGERYTHRWEKGYDNSIEFGVHGGRKCGWYSTEYRGCGNGHYYLALDERHAIYMETD